MPKKILPLVSIHCTKRTTLSSSGPIKRSGDLFLSIVITGEEGEEEGSFLLSKRRQKKIFPTFMMTYRRRKREGTGRPLCCFTSRLRGKGRRRRRRIYSFSFLFFRGKGEEGSIFFREG